MTQRCWKAIGRTLVVLATLATGGLTALSAQSTGKIEGYVTNAQNEPIANATVIVVGTAFSATTSPKGYYFFDNVPAGVIVVQAQYVGYKAKQVENVRVLSGQTGTLNFSLEQTAVQVQTITVVAATNPLVPRDAVTSKDVITGDVVRNLPVERISAALALQAGVVQTNSCSQNGACSATFSVRGSRTNEQATYIDGVPVMSAITGGMVNSAPTLGLAVNAFEDASITTGAADAEFSSAQGGVLNYSTRSGTSKFAGSLSWETAGLGGQTYGQAYNVFQGSVSGPIIKNMTFFVSGRVEGTASSNGGYDGSQFPSFSQVAVDTTYRLPVNATSATSDSTDVKVYDYAVVKGDCSNFSFVGNAASANQTASANAMRNNYGVSCNANQTYSSPSTTYYNSDKINYSFGRNSQVSLSYNFSGSQTRNALTDGGTTGTQSGSSVATLTWSQTIFRKPTHQLSLVGYLSEQWNNSITSRLTTASEADTRSSPMGIITHKLQFNVNQSDAPVDSTLLYNVLFQNTTGRIGLTDSKNTNQYSGQGSFNAACPPDPVSCSAGGGGAASNQYGVSWQNETQLIGKLDVDWQIDRYNRMKIGGQFDNWGQLTSYSGASSFTGKPVNRALYAEDRLDLGDVVLVGGIRYDYFWSKAYRWNEFPEISTRPGFADSALFCPPGTSTTAITKCALVQDPSHNYTSPHIQVAFPVNDKTNFRLSYAQAASQPSFDLIYLNSLTDINAGGANSRSDWGSDLDYGKTTKFEFGARHAFSDDMVLDVAVYNNDNVADPAIKFTYPIDPETNAPTRLYVAQNTDFGNARGIELTLDRRIGNYFNGRLDYTYESAVNTGTDPTSYIGYFEPLIPAGTIAEPPTAALTTGTSRPHNLAGQFTITLPADWEKGSILGAVFHRTSFFIQARVASGLPYTRCNPTDVGSIGTTSGNACSTLGAVTEINSARLPSYKQFDMRVTRDFRVGKYTLTGYLQGQNILNLQNITKVWTTTGTTSNGAEYALQYTSDSATFVQQGKQMGFYDAATGNINLPTSIAGCAKVASGNTSWAAPCYYYIRSEMRFGNGDGVYTLAEQRAASDQNNALSRSIANFVTGARNIRFGLEVNF
ncbi:MAG TPA: TonB-dependent receptor [Gemmatimonadales bacterium]|jgi:hypothetical protein|nr:TonB-dependent receptor [Gemmatimonadales bacterium]